MKLRLLGGAVLLLGLVTSAQADLKSTSGIERFEHFTKQVKTLEAFFTQEVVSEKGNIGQTSTGTLKLSRPGKFNWEYVKPVPQLIVSDGTKVSIYDKELEQVTVKPLDSALGASPAAILMSSHKIANDFNIREREPRENMKWIELEPRKGDTDFNRILVGMDDLGVQAMDLYDQFGRVTMIRFQESVVNGSIPASVFNFVPPKGVDVIGAGN